MSRHPGYPYPPDVPIRHCVMCANAYGPPNRQMGPPENGTLNSAIQVLLCDVCYWAFIRWCWEFFGNELSDSAIGGFTVDGYTCIQDRFQVALSRTMARHPDILPDTIGGVL